MWGNVTQSKCLVNGIPTISCLFPLVQLIINAALSFVGTVAVLLILYASVKYITSGGGKSAEEAKNILTYAIIGLIVVLFSSFIIILIGSITGVTCIQYFGFGTCH